MAVLRSTLALLTLGPAAVLFVGCPVDDRILKGPAETGGSSAAAGSPNTSGNTQLGGEGGAPALPGSAGSGTPGGAGQTSQGGSDDEPSYPAVIDGCVDLDQNDVADCQETLADNADFNASTESWAPDLAAVLSWANKNAYGATPSGSAQVTAVGAIDQDGLSQTATSQCLPAMSGKSLDIFANFFIESGQGEGLAAVGVFFYEQDGCTGALKTPILVSRADTDAWSTLKSNSLVPDAVSSMRVRLAVSKPYRTESFEVLFDNVLVKLR